MPWPRREVRARHDEKKFHKSDEFSQVLEEKIQFFAMIFKNFFDTTKDDYKQDADQTNREDNMLKNSTAGERDCRLWSRIAPGMREYTRACAICAGFLLFFFASAGPKVGPVCSDRSGTLRGFTAWLIYNRNPRCSVSGNTRYLAIKRSVVHPYHGV